MRVRVYQAFASNNSGSYVLLGTFRDAAVTTSVKEELERIFAEHHAWLSDASQVGGRRGDPSPLHAWAAARGLQSEPNVGADDDWPHYGEPPVVVASGDQLLVYVGYTVTFPRLAGELVYARGGRVSVELDHAHEPIVLSHEIWMHEGWKAREEAGRRIDAFRAAIDRGALAHLQASRRSPEPERSAPVVRGGFWPGQIVLVQAPFDVVEGLRAVDALAAEHQLRARVSLFESPVHGDDPIRAYRAIDPLIGGFDVILWRVGPDVVATQRAMRTALGLETPAIAELVAKAPIELVRDVAEADAERVRALVAESGAEVELVRPESKRAEHGVSRS